jgi:hypothetical protein
MLRRHTRLAVPSSVHFVTTTVHPAAGVGTGPVLGKMKFGKLEQHRPSKCFYFMIWDIEIPIPHRFSTPIFPKNLLDIGEVLGYVIY